jgi:molecular chaperone GrpE
MNKEKANNEFVDPDVLEGEIIDETVSPDNKGETLISEDEAPLEDMDPVQQEIESLKIQAAENLDKALRATAEMDNLRKRTSRDIENAHKYALDRFIKDLLPVVDSMEIGLLSADTAEDVASLKEGMDLTLKILIDSLTKSGVEVISPEGDKFDPEMHEAVSMTEVDGTESGMVVAVMQKGYSLNGRLVRPAMVVVSK